MSRRHTASTLADPVTPKDHALGSATAPVTLVEYGDFECPHCKRAHPIVREVRARLGARLRFVFRNFPLSNVHPHAEHAAEAAEAAGAQRKFFEMHDRLFERQFALEDENLVEYAKDLGLDAAAVARDLAGHVYKAKVRDDFMGGVRSGVNGTPTFYINGVRFDDSWDPDTLTAALERAARPYK